MRSPLPDGSPEKQQNRATDKTEPEKRKNVGYGHLPEQKGNGRSSARGAGNAASPTENRRVGAPG